MYYDFTEITFLRHTIDISIATFTIAFRVTNNARLPEPPLVLYAVQLISLCYSFAKPSSLLLLYYYTYDPRASTWAIINLCVYTYYNIQLIIAIIIIVEYNTIVLLLLLYCEPVA